MQPQEYEKLKSDPDVKHPEKHMLQKRRNQGQYQGCFSESHWAKKRREHHWDVFCDIAPRQAKQLSEVPNSVRPLIGIDVLKHSNSKFSVEEGMHSVPIPLGLAAEHILVDRIHMGEEVTHDFVTKLLVDMIDIWNKNVEKLAKEVQLSMGPELLRHCDATMRDSMSDGEIQELQQAAKAKLEAVLSNLRPCSVKKQHAALRCLGVTYFFGLKKILYCTRLFSLNAYFKNAKIDVHQDITKLIL